MRRPWVLVNMAMSADGRVDSVRREGARISSAADLARVSVLRAMSDAIMVGGRTLLAEDPRLTVRDAALVEARLSADLPAQPTRVAVVSEVPQPGTPGALPVSSRFLDRNGGRVIVFTTGATAASTLAWLGDVGADVRVHDGARVDLRHALDELGELGVERLMVEGGGTLVAALVEAGLADELRLFIAPLLLGGATAPGPLGGPGLPAPRPIRPAPSHVQMDEDGGVALRYLLGPGPGPGPYDDQRLTAMTRRRA